MAHHKILSKMLNAAMGINNHVIKLGTSSKFRDCLGKYVCFRSDDDPNF